MRHALSGVRIFCIGIISISALSCRPGGLRTRRQGSGIPPIVNVRDIRVLLVDRDSEYLLRLNDGFTIRGPSGGPLLGLDRTDGTIIRAGPDGDVRFGRQVLGKGVFELIPERQGGLIQLARHDGRGWGAFRQYPGSLRISVNGRGLVRIINVLDIETYVACVLPGELFPYFEPEAFRAQAVAARTYALYHMARRARQPYDVSAGTSSQVFLGVQSGVAADRAREAVNYTRGIVATWNSPVGERIFCTYYSSCCGGMTQNVENCRPDVKSIPPLSGGVACECMTVARGKRYRWPTVRLSKSEITTRLVARYPKLRTLGRITDLQVIERTSSGRPKMFRLLGSTGKSSDIVSEDFRLAMGGSILPSTNCEVRTESDSIVFANGKGFGHGMGLCQWGMQAMALKGHRAGEIIKHYYPTAHLTRAY